MRTTWQNVWAAAVVVAVGISAARAAEKSGDLPKMEDEQLTEFSVKAPEAKLAVGGFWVILPAGEYRYSVMLPKGYGENPKRYYPVVFLAKQGADAVPGNLEARVKRDKFVFVGVADDAGDPLNAAFLAAHDDVMRKFRVDERFRFMTGYGPGARMAGVMSRLRPGFAGVGLQNAGAGFHAPGGFQASPNMCAFAAFGYAKNKSLYEAAELPGWMPATTPRLLEVFNGGDEAAPRTEVDDMFNFWEDWAYVRSPGRSPRKEMYVDRFKDLKELAEKAEGIKKYELLEAAQAVATGRSLKFEAGVTEDLPTVAKTLKEMAKDASIAKELEAREAYRAVRSVEDANWPATVSARGNDMRLTKLILEAGRKYRDLGKKYPGTAYGERAKERGKWMIASAEKE